LIDIAINLVDWKGEKIKDFDREDAYLLDSILSFG
jgi:hypothetical protein